MRHRLLPKSCNYFAISLVRVYFGKNIEITRAFSPRAHPSSTAVGQRLEKFGNVAVGFRRVNLARFSRSCFFEVDAGAVHSAS